MLPVYQNSTFLGHIDKDVEIERWGSNVVLLPAVPNAFAPTHLEAVSFDLDRRAMEFPKSCLDEIAMKGDPQEELWKQHQIPRNASCDYMGESDQYRFSWHVVKVRNAAEHKLIFMMPDFMPAPIGDTVPEEEEPVSFTMAMGTTVMRPVSGVEKILAALNEKSKRNAVVSVPRKHGKTSVPTIRGMSADFVVMDELTKTTPVEDKLKTLLDAHLSATERRMADKLRKSLAEPMTSNIDPDGLSTLFPEPPAPREVTPKELFDAMRRTMREIEEKA